MPLLVLGKRELNLVLHGRTNAGSGPDERSDADVCVPLSIVVQIDTNCPCIVVVHHRVLVHQIIVNGCCQMVRNLCAIELRIRCVGWSIQPGQCERSRAARHVHVVVVRTSYAKLIVDSTTGSVSHLVCASREWVFAYCGRNGERPLL